MSKKLFVGGLSWNTTDNGLLQAFQQFGDVTEAKVITDRETGRSRGFGFVTFGNGEDADNAISAMNGTQLDGRTINVNEAQDKRREGGGGGGGGGGGRGFGGGGGGRGGFGGGGGRDGGGGFGGGGGGRGGREGGGGFGGGGRGGYGGGGGDRDRW